MKKARASLDDTNSYDFSQYFYSTSVPEIERLGRAEGGKGLKSTNAGSRDHAYLMVASTNAGFSKSKESSPSTFSISNAQMRLMRTLYTEVSAKCCLGHCLGQIHCHCMHL